MFAHIIFCLAFILKNATIELGQKKLSVALADTQEARSQGLMGKESLGADEGMLFIFEKPQIPSFWMKDTKIPLSIAFFDENKTLINIADMVPPSAGELPLPSYESKKPSLYALEVNQGWFQKNGIIPSMKFSFLD
jgi:uncharacterized membrane protein (UPF0127 family)